MGVIFLCFHRFRLSYFIKQIIFLRIVVKLLPRISTCYQMPFYEIDRSLHLTLHLRLFSVVYLFIVICEVLFFILIQSNLPPVLLFTVIFHFTYLPKILPVRFQFYFFLIYVFSLYTTTFLSPCSECLFLKILACVISNTVLLSLS